MEEITDIREIQNISLGILKYVDKICKENKITYALAGGTLLGAVRHKGFIPWDDDIDILMPRPDYERFLQIMDNDKSERYKALHNCSKYSDYFYRFCKVVDTNTYLEESTLKSNKNLGIFIDVFPADGINIKKTKQILKKHLFITRMINISRMKKVNTKDSSLIKNIGKYLMFPIAKIFGSQFWYKKYIKLIQKYPFEKYENCTLYGGMWGKKEIFPKSYLNDIIELQFEDGFYPAFKEYDKHLTHLYGDYMTPPPKEKQITHHDLKIYKK